MLVRFRQTQHKPMYQPGLLHRPGSARDATPGRAAKSLTRRTLPCINRLTELDLETRPSHLTLRLTAVTHGQTRHRLSY